jgi:hypothetical protein
MAVQMVVAKQGVKRVANRAMAVVDVAVNAPSAAVNAAPNAIASTQKTKGQTLKWTPSASPQTQRHPARNAPRAASVAGAAAMANAATSALTPVSARNAAPNSWLMLVTVRPQSPSASLAKVAHAVAVDAAMTVHAPKMAAATPIAWQH